MPLTRDRMYVGRTFSIHTKNPTCNLVLLFVLSKGQIVYLNVTLGLILDVLTDISPINIVTRKP